MVPPNVSAAVPVVVTAVSAVRVRFPFRLTFAADVMVPPREEVPVTVNVSPVPPVSVPPLSSKFFETPPVPVVPIVVRPERFTIRLEGVTFTVTAAVIPPEKGILLETGSVKASVPVVLTRWISPLPV